MSCGMAAYSTPVRRSMEQPGFPVYNDGPCDPREPCCAAGRRKTPTGPGCRSPVSSGTAPSAAGTPPKGAVPRKGIRGDGPVACAARGGGGRAGGSRATSFPGGGTGHQGGGGEHRGKDGVCRPGGGEREKAGASDRCDLRRGGELSFREGRGNRRPVPGRASRGVSRIPRRVRRVGTCFVRRPPSFDRGTRIVFSFPGRSRATCFLPGNRLPYPDQFPAPRRGGTAPFPLTNTEKARRPGCRT